MYFISEEQLMHFLLQLFVLLTAAKLLGLIFQKINQPTITADIIIGILLGPTILGSFFPKIHKYIFPDLVLQQNMLETIGWMGILFYLLATGFEINIASVWRQRKKAAIISISDIIIPMIFTFFPILFLPNTYLVNSENKILFSIFIATIMTISAMPISIRAMQELNILKTDMGFLIVSALSFNDIIGWVIFTIVLSTFAQVTPDPISLIVIIVGTVAFIVFAFTICRYSSDKIIKKLSSHKEHGPGNILAFVVLLGTLFGILTLKIGIHSLFGFFIAGIIAGESKSFSEKNRNTLKNIVNSVFVPIFFIGIGLKVNFIAHFDLFLTLFLTILGIGGRYLGAFLGSIFSKRPRSNWSIIAVCHIPGGEMHMIVSLLALEFGLITKTVFVSIVTAAIISSVIMGPWISYILKHRKKINMSELFSQSSIINVSNFSPREAILELCKNASERVNVDAELLCRSVMEREDLSVTSLGYGIAVPHAKIESISQPLIILGKSPGIEWNSPDGLPVKIVFLILTPINQYDYQIQILSQIATKFSNASLRESLSSSSTAETINILEKQFRQALITKKKK